jgi:methylenetetrahydrofolate dehydrogenase (NADP+)/methenyltetrahydrofolate cyclohydrolase
MRLLAHCRIPIAGKHAVVVGRSPILGRPMAMMLLNAHATVTICHSRTQGLPRLVQKADIVVAAVGKPEFIRGAWIRDGAVVIDAGYHPGGLGDVELQAVIGRTAAYTPVPGGVGPMTIATLMAHTVQATEQAPNIALEPSAQN